MEKIDQHSVTGLRDNLAALFEMTQAGASKAQVRSAVTYLRDIKQNFVACWRFAGLPGTPRIEGAALGNRVSKPGLAVLFGARDTGMLEKASIEFLGFEVGTPPNDGAAPAFTRREFSVPAFFAANVLRANRTFVSRYAVIEYAAYRLGAIHTHASIYHQENERQVIALDAFDAMTLLPTRNNIEHLLMSIAQDVCRSPDVVRFSKV